MDAVARADVKTSRRRPGRWLLLVAGLLVLTMGLGVAGWAAYLNHQLSAIPRFPVELDREGRPERVSNEAQNILLVGVDDGHDDDLKTLLQADHWKPGAFRSDAIMVLHIEPGGHGAQIVSIPRDSYVPVDGVGRVKINAAFSEGGPTLLAKTVEDLTGVYLDHVAVVDFAGFEDVTRAIGGVDVTVPRTVYDYYRDYTWTAGTHHIEGRTALLYVRQRANLPRGDLDRVQRQQNFLRAVLDKVSSAGVLTNPVRVTRLTTSVQDLLSVDDDWTPGEMRDLALSLRNLDEHQVGYVTVPVTGTPTIDGASVVTLDRPALRSLFAAVVHNRFNAWARSNQSDQLGPAAEVD